jgi:hypothetical protein
MSNRPLTVAASIVLVILAALISRSVEVVDQSPRSVSSRDSDSPDQDDQLLTADDDDSSDDFVLPSFALEGLPAPAVALLSFECQTIAGPASLPMRPTLESQHILLRL